MTNLRDELESALGDRYRLKGEIGLGGMGGMAWVFRAADLKHNREVALKVMRPELAAGFEGGTREVEMVARLRHPNIVPLFDSGKLGAGPGDAGPYSYYVMPFVEGESLRDRMEREEPI